MTAAPAGSPGYRTAAVFPPGLVPLVRDRFAAAPCSAHQLADPELDRLLTCVYLASLETLEGARYPIRVMLADDSPPELVLSQRAGTGEPRPYRWRMLPFAVPRPLKIGELVKLSIVSVDERLYTVVSPGPDGMLAVSGLAREGVQAKGDRYLRVIASRPGRLSILASDDRFLEYERGAVLAETDRIVREVGALTAVDGATVLTVALVPRAFGVVLPVDRDVPVCELVGNGAPHRRPVDLGARGTRHRAAATHAWRRPGSLVFVASTDGPVSFLYRGTAEASVTMWRLGPADVPGA